jgi:acyl dehydratase
MTAPPPMNVGDKLGPIERGPITTRQLVEYAGASLDFNRIHYDEPFAKAGGFPSVIAHGMLSMAFFGQLVAEAVGGPARIVQLQARFKAVAFPGDVIRISGEVVAVGADKAELKLVARRPDGTVALEGSATVRT